MPDNKAVVKTGNEKSISPAVIKRLPRYYRYLGDLLKNDVVRISSKELSQRMNVTASQIRQDLNNFGGFGQQGYGYNVEYLYNEMGKILGLDRTNNIVIVGAGNLGQALANNQDFDSNGFKIIGLFDVNPRLIGMTVRGVEAVSYTHLKNSCLRYDGIWSKLPRSCDSTFCAGNYLWIKRTCRSTIRITRMA